MNSEITLTGSMNKYSNAEMNRTRTHNRNAIDRRVRVRVRLRPGTAGNAGTFAMPSLSKQALHHNKLFTQPESGDHYVQ